jgi:hypothetical protein
MLDEHGLPDGNLFKVRALSHSARTT